MKDVIEKYWYQISNCIVLLYYNVKQGIGNLIKYTPIIWKDRDYDSYFLMTLIKFKLSNMSKDAKNNWISVDRDQMIDQMDRCVELIDMLYNDSNDYKIIEKQYNKFKEQYGNPTILCNNQKEYKVVYENGTSENYVKDKQKAEQANQQLKKLITLKMEKTNRCRNELFNILKKNVDNWWD